MGFEIHRAELMCFSTKQKAAGKRYKSVNPGRLAALWI
jgi:hypothetical protein